MSRYFFYKLVSCISLFFLWPAFTANGQTINPTFNYQSNSLITIDYFGIHIHRLVLRDADKGRYKPTAWPDVPFGYLRLWDTSTRWAELNQKKGEWNFERMDFFVNSAVEHNVPILYTLGSTPQWASARPDEKCAYGVGCNAEPNDMQDWEDYVRKVSARYKGKITAYELWNEPKFYSSIEDRKHVSGFYSGSAEKMLEMARVAKRVLNEVDPQAKLTTPGFDGGSRWMAMFLEKGGGQYIDAVTYHFYTNNTDKMISQIIDVKDVMKKYSLESLPLWNTESGTDVYANDRKSITGFTPDKDIYSASSHMTQYFVVGLIYGLEHFFYYSWDHDATGVVNKYGEVNSMRLNAIRSTQSWLIGAKKGQCQQFSKENSAYYCEFEKNNKKFIVAWSDVPSDYEIDSQWKIVSVEHSIDNVGMAEMGLHNQGIHLTIEPVKIELIRNGN